MTRITEALRGALTVAAALLTTAAAPAPATSQQAVPGNWLQLTLTPGEVSPPALPPSRAPFRTEGVPGTGIGGTGTVSPGTGTGIGSPGTGTGVPGTRGALLLCDPPQGHPHAARACAELAAAEGDIGRIPDTPGVLCPMIYAPVTAAARGAWDGRPVTYTHTFANSCVMGAATGAVFDLE
ncbi:serine protease [Streptomyces fagopyri]|uniref:Serine protease n=1 Tax=Streptomyces fagopyri TaxID=2662397 RepID=A0A5Q0L9T0_9ACTN|nr:SSI family serine proteinase inhibitor [Streptomyces fagopyri]QFZ73681.1 serine protease [Streptomyces fagopyri]